MTAPALAVHDSVTLLRRQLRRLWRYPELTVLLLGLPIIFLLLFVYVFGGTLGAGLPGGAGTRADYATYVVPGVLLMAVATVAQGTSTSVAMDMTQGIVARFRTLPIAQGAVLTGHVLSSVVQCLLAATVLLVLALAIGFRPAAGALDWLGVGALLVGISLAVSWIAVGCGLVARSVETASNLPMPLVLLPFLGSGFVPTDSMPPALAWFAEHQPFTPIMDALRGLLLGRAVPVETVAAAGAWIAVMALAGWLGARRAFARPTRAR